MDEREVEFVAEELAKVGGVSWYPGRQQGPVARVVSERFRDRARVAIAAVERYRSGSHVRLVPEKNPGSTTNDVSEGPDASVGLLRSDVEVGAVVIYRPPGDRRAYSCVVERIENGSAVLRPLVVSSFKVPLIEAADADDAKAS
jgi:hypothetical protein